MLSLLLRPAAGRIAALAATCFFVSVLVPAIAAATITLPVGLPQYSIGVTSNDQTVSGSDTDSLVLGTSLPLAGSLTAIDGDASAMVTYTLNQSVFDFDVYLQTAGNPLGGDGNNSFGALIRFSVDTPTAYAIDGSFSSTQTAGNGNAQIFVLLQNGPTVFQTDQQESVAEGEGFALEVDGSPGGDNVSSITGSQTGVLLPGADYFLYLTLASGMAQTPVSGAASSGSLTMSFATVPEPSTAVLLTLGLVGLAIRRR